MIAEQLRVIGKSLVGEMQADSLQFHFSSVKIPGCVAKHNDIHNNVAYIMTKYSRFDSRNEISK